MNPCPTIETTLIRGRVKLLQPKTGFHASLDTVFLAAGAEVKDKWKVLDIGCGVGSAGLCITSRNKNISLYGIDIQQELVDLAHLNASLNDVQDRCTFFCGNILTEQHIQDNFFNSIIMNPPYQGDGTTSPHKIKNLAHAEKASGTELMDWIKYAHKKLKNNGYLTVIHRADRMDELITVLTHRRWFGSLVVLPLWPHAGEPAKRVLIRARKERYAPLKLLPGLALHEADGSYTAAAKEVLEKGLPLNFD
jgi:tRNA1(Val) A37 N6-methylase TrmN6